MAVSLLNMGPGNAIPIIPGSVSAEHPQGLVAFDLAQINAYNKDVGLDAVGSFFIALLFTYMLFVWKRPTPTKWWMHAIEIPLILGVIGTFLLRQFG